MANNILGIKNSNLNNIVFNSYEFLIIPRKFLTIGNFYKLVFLEYVLNTQDYHTETVLYMEYESDLILVIFYKFHIVNLILISSLFQFT